MDQIQDQGDYYVPLRLPLLCLALARHIVTEIHTQDLFQHATILDKIVETHQRLYHFPSICIILYVPSRLKFSVIKMIPVLQTRVQ